MHRKSKCPVCHLRRSRLNHYESCYTLRYEIRHVDTDGTTHWNTPVNWVGGIEYYVFFKCIRCNLKYWHNWDSSGSAIDYDIDHVAWFFCFQEYITPDTRLIRWPNPTPIHAFSVCKKCNTNNEFYYSFGEKLQLLINYSRRTNIWLTMKTDFYTYFKCVPCKESYYIRWNSTIGPTVTSYGSLSEPDNWSRRRFHNFF